MASPTSCFRCGLILAGILLCVLGAYQFRADLAAIIYQCETTRIEFRSVDKNETDLSSELAPPAAAVYHETFPFHAKEVNISLAESFQDPDTVVYFLHQRKAGGSSLRQFLLDEYSAIVGKEKALATSYVPCHAQECRNWDPDPRRQFIGQKRLLAGHLSFTTAAARVVFGEKQVLISNFREPISRIESCIKFRFPKDAFKMFEQEVFNATQMANYFLRKPDDDGDSCLGEPFRILSPYNPDQIVPDEEIQEVCNFAKSYIHLVNFGFNATNPTKIEKELEMAGTKYKLNGAKLHSMTENFEANMKAFKDHIRGLPIVQSEIKLYECVSQDSLSF